MKNINISHLFDDLNQLFDRMQSSDIMPIIDNIVNEIRKIV